MATKVQTVLVSDISGKEIKEGEGQSIKFSIGTTSYEIDLTDSEAGKFYDDLKKYTDVATKTSGRGIRSGTRAQVVRDYDPKAVKAWAASNGIDVPSRGRLPISVVEQFKAAGN